MTAEQFRQLSPVHLRQFRQFIDRNPPPDVQIDIINQTEQLLVRKRFLRSRLRQNPDKGKKQLFHSAFCQKKTSRIFGTAAVFQNLRKSFRDTIHLLHRKRKRFVERQLLELAGDKMNPDMIARRHSLIPQWNRIRDQVEVPRRKKHRFLQRMNPEFPSLRKIQPVKRRSAEVGIERPVKNLLRFSADDDLHIQFRQKAAPFGCNFHTAVLSQIHKNLPGQKKQNLLWSIPFFPEKSRNRQFFFKKNIPESIKNHKKVHFQKTVYEV